MDFASIIAEAQRKAQYRRQTEAAEALEHTHEIASANERATGFVRNIILPMLKRAEDDLRAAGIIAMTTERFNEICARCMLSASLDEDRPPAYLAFEACTGRTAPRILWTTGSTPAPLTDLNPVTVKQIITEFLNRAIH